MPAVRLLNQRIRGTESAAHPGAQRSAMIAIDIHVAVEVSIEQTDVTESDALQLGGALVKPQRKSGGSWTVTVLSALAVPTPSR